MASELNNKTAGQPGGVGDANVQSDWNETNSSKDEFIKNKPSIPNISGKQDTIDASNKDSIKTTLELDNVNNTADTQKPVSNAQQTALDLKLNTSDIKDGLTHTDTNKPGSAKNDKDLKDLVDGKANKVPSPTNGNLITTDANGNPVDSGETVANLKDGWDGTVATFADLPSAASNNGKKYAVTTATGTIILGTKKYAGTYISNGTSWEIFGYKQASVINQLLSGLSAHASVESLAATDSILSGFKKIDKWYDDLLNGVSSNIQTQLNAKQDHLLAKDFVDASVSDIKTIIDNWGSAATLVGYNYQLHGNYSGDDITIDGYYNISFSGTDSPTGSPHTVFGSRSLTLEGSDCTRIKATNINIEGGLIVSGTQGRHYFEKCILGGLTVSSTTNWISFIDCTFSGAVTINSNFAGAVYFVRCAFGNQSVTLNNTVSTQVVLSDCSGLQSIPTNAFKSGLTSLASGVSYDYLNNVARGTAAVLDAGTSAGNVPVIGSDGEIPSSVVPSSGGGGGSARPHLSASISETFTHGQTRTITISGDNLSPDHSFENLPTGYSQGAPVYISPTSMSIAVTAPSSDSASNSSITLSNHVSDSSSPKTITFETTPFSPVWLDFASPSVSSNRGAYSGYSLTGPFDGSLDTGNDGDSFWTSASGQIRFVWDLGVDHTISKFRYINYINVSTGWNSGAIKDCDIYAIPNSASWTPSTSPGSSYLPSTYTQIFNSNLIQPQTIAAGDVFTEVTLSSNVTARYIVIDGMSTWSSGQGPGLRAFEIYGDVA